jgi:adenosylcobinamide kinase/adenosylcobinamide-phosphate guanylyltransferase
MRTIEEPLALAATIKAHSQPNTLIVVDCLTLWLTAHLMPPDSDCTRASETGHMGDLKHPINRLRSTDTGCLTESHSSSAWQTLATDLCSAIAHARGPLVLVGNEIGLGVIPLGQEVRAFVDALGLLNQMVAATCERVTLMSAGLPLALKGAT